MKGLLYKEVVSLLGLYKKNLLLVAVVYGVLSLMQGSDFFLYFGIWMMGFYTLSGFNLDDSSGWGRYARTLPISDGQVVGAKFLSALVFMAMGLAFALVIGAIRWGMRAEGFAWREFLGGALLVTAIALASIGVMFLLAVKFGPDKARNYYLVFFMAVFVLAFLAGKMGVLDSLSGMDVQTAVGWVNTNAVLVTALVAAVAVAVFFLCYLAACAVYRRKEF